MDPFVRLRPAGPVPDDEICACPRVDSLLLAARLSANPVSCFVCRRELPPERLNYDHELIDALAGWASLSGALVHLWLDTGEYEAWAVRQLEDPRAPVNTRALALVAALRAKHPTWFWWFRAAQPGDPGWEAPEACPSCAGALVACPPWVRCDRCGVVSWVAP